MEELPLTDYLAEHTSATGEHADQCASQLWYNRYGDCIEYQTEQVAIVADRIDNWLTIYRSAETNTPIGFQLKDVTALMKQFQASSYGVAWTTQEKRLYSVSALLLAAIEAESPLTIQKRRGYQEALKMRSKSDDEVTV